MAEVSAVDVSKSGQIKAKLLVALLLFIFFFVIRVEFSHKVYDFIPTTSSIRTRIQCSCNTLVDALQKPQIWGCLNGFQTKKNKKKHLLPKQPESCTLQETKQILLVHSSFSSVFSLSLYLSFSLLFCLHFSSTFLLSAARISTYFFQVVLATVVKHRNYACPCT